MRFTNRYAVIIAPVIFAFFLAGFASENAHAGSLQPLEAIASRAKTLEDFLSRPDLVESYRKALKQYQHRDNYRCESFDQIIQKLRVLALNVPGFSERLWEKMDGSPITVDTLSGKNQKIVVTYKFNPIPRRFHGIWNDPSVGKCQSDDCAKNDSMSPERWAVLLQHNLLYYVERNGEFADQSIMLTPVHDGKKIFPLITISGISNLQNSLVVLDSTTKEREETTLFSVWAQSIRPLLPARWGAFITLDRAQRQIAQVHPESSDPGVKTVGRLKDFEPLDPMAKDLETSLPRQCVAQRGSTPGSRFLGLSDANANPKKTILFFPARFFDPTNKEAVLRALNGSSPLNLAPFSAMAPKQRSQAASTLANIFQSDPNALNRAKAGLALDAVTDRRGEPGTTNNDLSRDLSSSDSTSTPSFPTNTFRHGLKDADPDVRGISAMELLKHGSHDPSLATPISDMLQGNQPKKATGDTPNGGDTSYGLPPYLNPLAADTLLNSGVPLTQPQFNQAANTLGNQGTPAQKAEAAKDILNRMRNKDGTGEITTMEVFNQAGQLQNMKQGVVSELMNQKPTCSAGSKGGN